MSRGSGTEQTCRPPGPVSTASMRRLAFSTPSIDSAIRNLQMAITYEPGNDFFKEKLKALRGHTG